MSDLVGKLWGFCHTLRHDGVDYGDYIEQITYLLFLKMAAEKDVAVPGGCEWGKLRDQAGTDLTDHYVEVLRTLGKQPGILGDIYAGAQSRFADPVNLKRLVNLIDETEWTALGVDVKAHAYEGLLEKAASEGKKGAGQYFTPRVLIQTMVRCLKPDPRGNPSFTVCDPACGTGGFLVAAYEWLMQESKGGALDRDTSKRVKRKTYHGTELVARPRRMALMNLFLHGVEPRIGLSDAIYNQAPERDDFTVQTSNKQLNFVQHILTVLKPGGRAGVVLPDNCMFADQAGEVFKIVAEDCALHTVLRLPRGTFTPYSQGVKANVVFFTKGEPTTKVWIYDARTNVPTITKKDRPLTPAHFAEFEECFGDDPNGRSKRKPADSKEDRWRAFSMQEVRDRGFKLDGFKWLKDESAEDADELPEPEELAAEAMTNLRKALVDVEEVLKLLEREAGA
jgi:type I restriction enzyme M protein